MEMLLNSNILSSDLDNDDKVYVKNRLEDNWTSYLLWTFVILVNEILLDFIRLLATNLTPK